MPTTSSSPITLDVENVIEIDCQDLSLRDRIRLAVKVLRGELLKVKSKSVTFQMMPTQNDS